MFQTGNYPNGYGYMNEQMVKEQERPMRVVLLEQKEIMHSLWLPPFEAGLYRFDEDAEPGESIPVSIHAENGQYYAIAERGGCFYLDEMPVGNSVRLADRILARAVFGDRIYAIYAEYENENDNVFIPYYFEQRTQITIGRHPDCEVLYNNNRVSRHHARLIWGNNHWYVLDDGSKNGVYVNGRKIGASDGMGYDAEKQAVSLATGDVIYIMGLYLIVGAGYIAMNNACGRVIINSPKIRPIETRGDVAFAKCPYLGRPETFDRQPRRRTILKPDPIVIENPPMPMSENKIPLLLRLGNPLVSGGRALVTGNILSAVSSMVLPGITQVLTEKERKEYEAKRQEMYSEYLVNREKAINEELVREWETLNRQYPALNTVLHFSNNRKRLWERQKNDEDFLSVRIGYGDITMLAKKEYSSRRLELEPDPLEDQMYDLCERRHVVVNAPIMVDLRKNYICGILGDKRRSAELIRNMIIQTALTHSYDEVKIILIVDKEDAQTLDFTRYLPHNWDNERSLRFFVTNRTEAQQINKHLNKLYDELGEKDNIKKVVKKRPAYIVFASNKELFDSVEVLKLLTEQEEYCGFSIITSFKEAPKESKLLLTLDAANSIVHLAEPEIEDQPFALDDLDPSLAEYSLHRIMRTRLKMGSQQYTLPNMITFLEMYNAGKVEHLNPLKRWEESNPVKSLAAPIGVGTDGKLFTLDLHEKRQGPHGLVAGMTGSGKSEFIITYLLSMAVSYSPDEVAFILIDYKGGGLADAFVDPKRGIHLPHVVGTITNLDGAAIQRSLLSINSELKRRQAVFKQAKSETNTGTMDIYDYQKFYRQGRVKEPMPHLFIVSDEFAELKKQQPEFMDELISTARIGRSLGVHLILATQKPSGVVNDQIWSNTKFRVCLKVQDRGDSQEMLKRPEAAELKNTGRFYLQVGYNELFALGQSAWCGAGYIPRDEVVTEVDDSVRFIDLSGQTVLEAKKKQAAKKADTKQIVAIVQYLSDLAKRENIIPRSLWEEPLTDKIDYEPLAQEYKTEKQGVVALMGMVDDPAHQARFPLEIDLQSMHNMLLCGESGSGKSTFINTMLYSLVTRYTPEEFNYYILDLSDGALGSFKSMPHCGAYLTEANEADFDRLMDLIKEIIAERKALFKKADVTNFDAYLKIKKLPLVTVIIDGYVNLLSFRKGNDYHAVFYEQLRAGTSLGIRYIFTANHLGEVHSKARNEIDYRIALKAKDRYEYSDILETRVKFEIPEKPGRGICSCDGEPLEYHTAMVDPEVQDSERLGAMRNRLEAIAPRYAAYPKARPLPMVVSGQSYSEFCASAVPGRIPLGYHLKDAKRVDLPLKQLLTLSMYFGNPAGIAPVWENILHAAKFNNMHVVILRRAGDSMFLNYSDPDTEVLDCTEESLLKIDTMVKEELAARNVFRDNYCLEHGIPRSDKKRVQKAAGYIAANTKPILFLLEGMGDICRMASSEQIDMVKEDLKLFLTRLKGYNLYYVAGFYPEDEQLTIDPLFKACIQEQLLLLFGGKNDKQPIAPNLPTDYRRKDKPDPKYDVAVLKYRDAYYQILMPCGELKAAQVDPDDAAII